MVTKSLKVALLLFPSLGSVLAMTGNLPTGVPLDDSKVALNPTIRICAIQPPLRPASQTPAQAIDHAINLIHTASRFRAVATTTTITTTTITATKFSDPNEAASNENNTNNSNCESKGTKIDLFVLPELSPIGYSEHTFAHYLPDTPEKQQLYTNLDAKMAETAQQLNAHICYGTIGWHSNNTNREVQDDCDNKDDSSYPPFQYTIRQIVVEPSAGQKVAVYDKVYLCDYGDCAETRFFVPSPSQQPVSFAIGTFRLGLMICADQRIPTLARTYAASPEHNVDILLQPAAFVRDVSFATWKSFRETRAVENSCYFLGVNYCGEKYGETTLVPPWVDDSGNADSTATSLAYDESSLVCNISRSVLQNVRTTFPFYRVLKAEAAAATPGGAC